MYGVWQADISGQKELSKFNDQAADINFADYSGCRDAQIAQTSDGGIGNGGSVSVNSQTRATFVHRAATPSHAGSRGHDP